MSYPSKFKGPWKEFTLVLLTLAVLLGTHFAGIAINRYREVKRNLAFWKWAAEVITNKPIITEQTETYMRATTAAGIYLRCDFPTNWDHASPFVGQWREENPGEKETPSFVITISNSTDRQIVVEIPMRILSQTNNTINLRQYKTGTY